MMAMMLTLVMIIGSLSNDDDEDRGENVFKK